jgi:hypothetical protein
LAIFAPFSSFLAPPVITFGTSCALLALWMSVLLLTHPSPDNQGCDRLFAWTGILILIAIPGLWYVYGNPHQYLWFLAAVIALLVFATWRALRIGSRRLLALPAAFVIVLIIIPFVLVARTPEFLYESVVVGDTLHTRVLLVLGGDPNHSPYNNSLLSGAISDDVSRPYGVPEMVRLLLAYGADPNTSKTSLGSPALQDAAYHGEFEIAFDLLRAGALPEQDSDRGAKLLRWGAYYGHRAFLSAVLALEGVDVNARLPYSGRSALFEAKSPAIAEFLLIHGANMDLRIYQGETLLHWSARYSNPEMLRYWLGKGLSPESKDAEGHTALMVALLPFAERDSACPQGDQIGAIQILTEQVKSEDPERQQALRLAEASSCENLRALIE